MICHGIVTVLRYDYTHLLTAKVITVMVDTTLLVKNLRVIDCCYIPDRYLYIPYVVDVVGDCSIVAIVHYR